MDEDEISELAAQLQREANASVDIGGSSLPSQNLGYNNTCILNGESDIRDDVTCDRMNQSSTEYPPATEGGMHGNEAALMDTHSAVPAEHSQITGTEGVMHGNEAALTETSSVPAEQCQITGIEVNKSEVNNYPVQYEHDVLAGRSDDGGEMPAEINQAPTVDASQLESGSSKIELPDKPCIASTESFIDYTVLHSCLDYVQSTIQTLNTKLGSAQALDSSVVQHFYENVHEAMVVFLSLVKESFSDFTQDVKDIQPDLCMELKDIYILESQILSKLKVGPDYGQLLMGIKQLMTSQTGTRESCTIGTQTVASQELEGNFEADSLGSPITRCRQGPQTKQTAVRGRRAAKGRGRGRKRKASESDSDSQSLDKSTFQHGDDSVHSVSNQDNALSKIPRSSNRNVGLPFIKIEPIDHAYDSSTDCEDTAADSPSNAAASPSNAFDSPCNAGLNDDSTSNTTSQMDSESPSKAAREYFARYRHPTNEFVLPKCTECRLPFCSQQELIDHLTTEHPDAGSPVPCPQCPRVYTSEKARHKHDLDVHRKNKACGVCGRRFAYQYELEQHMLLHKGIRPFKCQLCSFTTSKRAPLNIHIRSKHPGAPLSKGEGGSGGKASGGRGKRKKRGAEEEEEEDSIYASGSKHLCMVCDERFATSELLESHVTEAHEFGTHVKQEQVGDSLDDSATGSTDFTSQQHDGGNPEAAANRKFQCKSCARSFTTGRLLQKHVTRVHMKKYKCSKCGHPFAYPAELAEHERLHDRTGESGRFLHCDFCERPYRTKSLLLAHARLQHSAEMQELRFECDVCSARFPTSCQRDSHMRTHKTVVGEIQVFSCQHCFRAFPSALKRDQHEQSEHQPSVVATENKTTDKMAENEPAGEAEISLGAEVNDRMGDHSTDQFNSGQTTTAGADVPSPARKMCIRCGQDFSSRQALLAHRREAHSYEPDPKFGCSECGKECENKEALRQHQRRVHTKNKQCTLCGEKFAFQYILDRHILTHTGEKNYTCELCTRDFYSLKELNIHVRLSHNERTFECTHCSSKFCTKQSLERHIMHRHTAFRPLRCEFCGKGFIDKRELNAHIFTHTRQSDIKCEHCGKMFGTNSCRNKHIRTVHKQEKKLCPICGKHVVSHLGTHMKSHGEKRYKCDQCPNVYAWPTALKEHKRTHTGEKPYVCTVCNKSFLGSANFAKHKKVHVKAENRRHRVAKQEVEDDDAEVTDQSLGACDGGAGAGELISPHLPATVTLPSSSTFDTVTSQAGPGNSAVFIQPLHPVQEFSMYYMGGSGV